MISGTRIRLMTKDELHSTEFYCALVGEFLATTIYMIIVCGACLPINDRPQGGPPLLHCALTTAFAIALLAHAFWDISGGHFNPVVTLAMMINGKVSVVRCISYVLVQIAGSFAGTVTLKALTPSQYEAELGALTVAKGIPVQSAFTLELVLTFFFIWVVLASTAGARDCPGFQAPFAIGLSVGTSIMMAGGYHGCSLNPVRALGPAVLADKLEDHWLYWVAPILGSTAATFVFELLSSPILEKAKAKTSERPSEQPDVPLEKVNNSDRHELPSAYTNHVITLPVTRRHMTMF